MRIIDNEISKVSKSSIKNLEPVLYEIDKEEASFIDEFNNNIEEIFKDNYLNIITELSKTPNIDNIKTRLININGNEYKIPFNIFEDFHKSYISNLELASYFEEQLRSWFTFKRKQIELDNINSNKELLEKIPKVFALTSLAISSFIKEPKTSLTDVQKMAGIVMSEGEIAELPFGEGKLLSSILTIVLYSLRNKGVHFSASDSYLAKKYYEDTLPIYKGLGISSSYIPESIEEYRIIEKIDDNEELEKKLIEYKKNAYKSDVTYSTYSLFATDYLHDILSNDEKELLQRSNEDKISSLLIIDNVDTFLIKNAKSPIQLEKEINKELLNKYQEEAIKFLQQEKVDVFVATDNTLGYKTALELYKAIIDDNNDSSYDIRRKYDIVYCETIKEFKISDQLFSRFLKYFYLNSHIEDVKDIVINDKRFKENEDYYYEEEKLHLTEKIIDDIFENVDDYIDIILKYNNYLIDNSSELPNIFYSLYQIICELLLKKKIDKYDNMNYSITQKSYCSLYECFTGVTVASPKETIGNIYEKGTVRIPRNSVYSYYGSRKKDTIKPTGFEIKETQYVLNLDDKINLIINSINDSRRHITYQPVIIIVSNKEELQELEDALKVRHFSYNTIKEDTKQEDRIKIISKAGEAGNITICVEDFVEELDIVIGGDRESYIDVVVEETIKEKITDTKKEDLRKKIEEELISNKIIKDNLQEQKERKDLERIGIKVISCGIMQNRHKERIVESIMGKNEISGVFERYISPKDFEKMGVLRYDSDLSIEEYFSKFKRNQDGSLEIDKNIYNALLDVIFNSQKEEEQKNMELIKKAQQINNYSSKLLDEYRKTRKEVLCNKLNLDDLIREMISDVIDTIISSYFTKKVTSLNSPISINRLDIEAVSLEIKEILGITFDIKKIIDTKMSYIEFRNAMIIASKIRADAYKDKEKQALLKIYDNMIANVSVISDNIFTIRNILEITSRIEGDMSIFTESNIRRKILLDSYKIAFKPILGISLSKEEMKKLLKKQQQFKLLYIENDNDSSTKVRGLGILNKLRKLSEKREKKDRPKPRIIDKTIIRNNIPKPINLDDICSNLNVRPIKLINTVINGQKMAKIEFVKS